MKTNNAINFNNKLKDGEIRIGSNNGTLNISTITAGNGISIQNGSNFITVTNTFVGESLPSQYGGTGVSSPTNNGVMIANGPNPMTFPTLNDGQILIGSSDFNVIPSNIIGENNIIVENGPGSITVSNATYSDFLIKDNNLNDVSSKQLSSLNLIENIFLNQSTTLDSSYFGCRIITRMNTTTSMELILPSPVGNAGKIITFFCENVIGSILNITASFQEGYKISTQDFIQLGRGDCIELTSNGVDYVISKQFLNPCSFLALMSGTNPLPANTETIVPFNNVISNVGSAYNSSSYTFTPNMPGYYEFFTYVQLTRSTPSNESNLINRIKNNSEIIEEASNFYFTAAGNTPSNYIGYAERIYIFAPNTNNFSVFALIGNSSNILFGSGACYFGAKRISFF